MKLSPIASVVSITSAVLTVGSTPASSAAAASDFVSMGESAKVGGDFFDSTRKYIPINNIKFHKSLETMAAAAALLDRCYGDKRTIKIVEGVEFADTEFQNTRTEVRAEAADHGVGSPQAAKEAVGGSDSSTILLFRYLLSLCKILFVLVLVSSVTTSSKMVVSSNIWSTRNAIKRQRKLSKRQLFLFPRLFLATSLLFTMVSSTSMLEASEETAGPVNNDKTEVSDEMQLAEDDVMSELGGNENAFSDLYQFTKSFFLPKEKSNMKSEKLSNSQGNVRGSSTSFSFTSPTSPITTSTDTVASFQKLYQARTQLDRSINDLEGLANALITGESEENELLTSILTVDQLKGLRNSPALPELEPMRRQFQLLMEMLEEFHSKAVHSVERLEKASSLATDLESISRRLAEQKTFSNEIQSTEQDSVSLLPDQSVSLPDKQKEKQKEPHLSSMFGQGTNMDHSLFPSLDKVTSVLSSSSSFSDVQSVAKNAGKIEKGFKRLLSNAIPSGLADMSFSNHLNRRHRQGGFGERSNRRRRYLQQDFKARKLTHAGLICNKGCNEYTNEAGRKQCNCEELAQCVKKLHLNDYANIFLKGLVDEDSGGVNIDVLGIKDLFDAGGQFGGEGLLSKIDRIKLIAEEVLSNQTNAYQEMKKIESARLAIENAHDAIPHTHCMCTDKSSGGTTSWGPCYDLIQSPLTTAAIPKSWTEEMHVGARTKINDAWTKECLNQGPPVTSSCAITLANSKNTGSANTRLYGGSGGSNYVNDSKCPDGSVLVGFQGTTAFDGNTIIGIQGICGIPALENGSGPAIVITKTGETTEYHGASRLLKYGEGLTLKTNEYVTRTTVRESFLPESAGQRQLSSPSSFAPLTQGYVEIRSSINGNMCLDVKQGGKDDFTRLQLYVCNGTPAQKFFLDSSGRLRSNLKQDFCVEMDPNTQWGGVFMHSACIDKWEILNNGSLRNIGDQKCMSIQSSVASSGTQIVRENCSGQSRQIWQRYLSNKGLDGSDLGQCEGDCDSDSDCQSALGLVCYHRIGFSPVPGCSGTGLENWDYCIPPPPLKSVNLDASNLGQCEGDCDSDSDCQSGLGLVCYHRNGLEPVPGCSGTGENAWDYCITPLPTAPPTPLPTPLPTPSPTSSPSSSPTFLPTAAPGFRVKCAQSNEVVVGFLSRAAETLGLLQFRCAPLKIKSNEQIEIGAPRYTKMVGQEDGGDTSNVVDCPTGMVASSLLADVPSGSSDKVHKVGLGCESIGIELPSASACCPYSGLPACSLCGTLSFDMTTMTELPFPNADECHCDHPGVLRDSSDTFLNSYTCASGRNGGCANNKVCSSQEWFSGTESLVDACVAVAPENDCVCDNPGNQASGMNGYSCRDGTSAHCSSGHYCAAQWFDKSTGFDDVCMEIDSEEDETYEGIFHTLKSTYRYRTTGGCVGRDELGTFFNETLQGCAGRCDGYPFCVSFEYSNDGGETCRLSATCKEHAMILTKNVTNPNNWYRKMPEESLSSSMVSSQVLSQLSSQPSNQTNSQNPASRTLTEDLFGYTSTNLTTSSESFNKTANSSELSINPTIPPLNASKAALNESLLTGSTLNTSMLTESTLNTSMLTESTLNESSLTESTLNESSLTEATLNESTLNVSMLDVSTSTLNESTLNVSTLDMLPSTLNESTFSEPETVSLEYKNETTAKTEFHNETFEEVSTSGVSPEVISAPLCEKRTYTFTLNVTYERNEVANETELVGSEAHTKSILKFIKGRNGMQTDLFSLLGNQTSLPSGSNLVIMFVETVKVCSVENSGNVLFALDMENAEYDEAFATFSEDLIINDAAVESQCQNARELLGFERGYLDDNEICRDFYDVQCDFREGVTDSAQLLNKYKTETGGPIPDFQGFEFETFSFEELTWNGVSPFEGFDFEGFEYEGATYEGATFTGFDFSDSEFTASQFAQSTFAQSTFAGSDFSGADFSASDFSASDFSASDFIGSDFSASDFTGADFSASDFAGSGFKRSEFVVFEYEAQDFEALVAEGLTEGNHVELQPAPVMAKLDTHPCDSACVHGTKAAIAITEIAIEAICYDWSPLKVTLESIIEAEENVKWNLMIGLIGMPKIQVIGFGFFGLGSFPNPAALIAAASLQSLVWGTSALKNTKKHVWAAGCTAAKKGWAEARKAWERKYMFTKAWDGYYYSKAIDTNLRALSTKLHQDLGIINGNIQKDGEMLSTQHGEVLEQLSVQHTSLGQQLTSQHNDVAQQLSVQHTSLGQQLTEQHNSIGTQLTDQHNSIGTQLTVQHTSLGEQLTKQHNSIGTQLNEQLNSIGVQLTEQHTSLGEQLTSQHNSIGDQLTEQHNSIGNQLTEQHNSIGTQLTEQHNTIGNQLTEQHTSIGNQLTEQHNSMGDQLTEQHNSIGNQLTEQHNSIGNQLTEQHNSIGNQLTEQHNSLGEQLTEQHNSIGNQLTEQHNSIGDQLTEQHNSIGDQLTEQHNSIGEQLTNQHNEIGSQLTEQHNEIGNQLTEQHNSIGEQLTDQHTSVGEQLTSQHKILRQNIVALSTALGGSVDDEGVLSWGGTNWNNYTNWAESPWGILNEIRLELLSSTRRLDRLEVHYETTAEANGVDEPFGHPSGMEVVATCPPPKSRTKTARHTKARAITIDLLVAAQMYGKSFDVNVIQVIANYTNKAGMNKSQKGRIQTPSIGMGTGVQIVGIEFETGEGEIETITELTVLHITVSTKEKNRGTYQKSIFFDYSACWVQDEGRKSL